VLLFHQLFDDLFQIVDLADVGVGGLPGGENVSAFVEEGYDVRALPAAVLGLDVVYFAFIAKIVIESNNHVQLSGKMYNGRYC
jgi:hypothetical protein